VAHEIGHIKNLDVRFLTIAGVMLGAIVVLAEIFLRSLWYTGGRRRVGGSRGGGQAQIILVLFAVAVAILAPLAARMLYLACSRQREYLADASAARFTRFPAGLASALRKISGLAARQKKVNRALAPMYIVNPLQSPRLTGLFSTHPPTERRIEILQGMAGASWADYEAAYRGAHGAGATALLDRGVLGSDPEPVPIRAATPDADGRQAAGETAREVVDLLDRTLGLLLIPCACGVRIKVPSDLDRDRVPCPRCGREHAVPAARPAAAGSSGGERPEGEVLRFQRSGKDWESFRCACGRALEVSPAFRAGTMTCPDCKRRISVT
jgi:heat shock protein HtpX